MTTDKRPPVTELEEEVQLKGVAMLFHFPRGPVGSAGWLFMARPQAGLGEGAHHDPVPLRGGGGLSALGCRRGADVEGPATGRRPARALGGCVCGRRPGLQTARGA